MALIRKKLFKKRGYRLVVTILLFILVFLRPHPTIFHPIISTFIGDFILILLTISYLFFKKKITYINEFLSLYYIILVLGFILIIPTSYHGIFNGDISVIETTIRIYYMIFMTFFFISYFYKNYFNFNRIMYYVAVIIFIIATIQLFEIPILFDAIGFLYHTDKLRFFNGGYPRIYSTFFNANWFGAYLVLFLAFNNTNYMFKKINFRKYLFFLMLTITMLLVSGSRTALIGSTVMFSSQFFLYKLNYKSIFNFIVFLVSIYAVFLAINTIPEMQKTLLRFTSFIYNFQYGADISQYDSRGDIWTHWIYNITNKPIFGIGTFDTTPHNSYIYILGTYGFFFGTFGLLLFFTAFAYIVIYLKKNNSYSFVLISSLWLALFSMSFFAEFFLTTQVMLSYLLITAHSLVTSNNRRIENVI